ncbi:lantibiotic dehydratase [Streptomonospora nanhaiensis]|uniref:lantibiotic dehydratase n=1 Tax=Streptomonospora nanhaiensis TaxID=1323731 RepID=UPI001C99EB0F|nr:lantibiotic dehydratase [Streptomonospora nanhaiensis]MBX9387644.1 lantibiotic dehydratase [Streptomonospora nanhaiensis]
MSRALFRRCGPALLRAACARPDDLPKVWPDLAHGRSGDLRSWVATTWRPPLSTAIGDASPSLASTLDALAAGDHVDEVKTRRAAAALTAYALRAVGRATPFGLFAGSAPAHFAAAGKVRWGEDHRVEEQIDAAVLDTAATDLESIPELLETCEVVADQRCRPRGPRIVLVTGVERVEARNTAPARLALAEAAAPVPAGVLAERVHAAFPGAPRQRVWGLIADLVAGGFLISQVRSAVTAADGPLLLRRAASLCGTEAATAVLRRHGIITDTERQARLMRQVRLDCEVTVPEVVAAEVEKAATALLRLSPHPAGHPIWRHYYQEFVHRYGAWTLVPLLDAVDADSGLGLPPTYPGALLVAPEEPDTSARDAHLLRLAHRAAVTGSDEVVLDDAELDRLAVGPVEEHRVPAHVEAAVRISAPTMAALEAGEFLLRLRPARAIGTLTARFTPAGSPLAQVLSAVPPRIQGAVCAQLLFPARHPAAANMARVPLFLPHAICVGTFPPEEARELLDLGDLALLADEQRLHLVHVPTRRIVEPQVLHALALEHQAGPLARFLANLPRGCDASFTTVDWGRPADALPALPRLRYGRTVLAPARWRLSADDLPDAAAAWRQWYEALQDWRRTWRLPAAANLVQGDKSLPLDLGVPAHAYLLRRRIDTAGEAVLTEAFDGCGWLEGRTHEFAVAMVATAPALPSPLDRTLARTTDRTRGQAPAAPGARWLYAKIYAHPERHDEILAAHLPRLLAGLDTPWWFVRYRAPGDPDHLRLRLRVADPGHAADLARALSAWHEELRRTGLTPRLALDTYYPETGRYGEGLLLEAAEAVFAADSAAVLSRLQHTGPNTPDPRAATAAALVALAGALCGGSGLGRSWLIAQADDPRTPHVPRDLQRQATALADPAAPPPLPQPLLAALQRYARLLATDGPPLDSVITSLIHMHCNRSVGTARATERICRRLARHAALSWTSREEHR